MTKNTLAIFGFIAISISAVFGPSIFGANKAEAGTSSAVLTVLMDSYAPTNNKVIAGQKHTSIARFLISANGQAEIHTIDVSTYSWDAIFKFAITSDSEYQKPVLYNETDQQEIAYEFSNLSWGNATLNLVSPLVINDGQTKILRVDAKAKRNAQGEAQFALDSLVLKDINGAAYEIAPSSLLGGTIMKQHGNTFLVSDSTYARNVQVSASGAAPVTVEPGQNEATLFSFKVTGGDSPVNIGKLWLISDTPEINTMIDHLQVRDEDGQMRSSISWSTVPFASTIGVTKGYLYVYLALNKAIYVSGTKTLNIVADILPGATNGGRIGIAGLGFNDYIEPFNNGTNVTGSLPIFGEFKFSESSPAPQDEEPFYLTFNNTLTDVSGRGPSAIGSESGIIYGQGVKGQAVKFSNSGSFAEYRNNYLFNESSGTIQALIKFDKGYGSDAVIWHTDDSNYVLYYDESSDGAERRLMARAGDGNGRPAVYSFDQHFGKNYYAGRKNTFTTGEWHQVAMTWEGSPIGTIKIYVDGQLMSTSQYQSTSGAETFRVGNNYWPGLNWGQGWIDELKLYTSVRSAEEIKRDYDGYHLSTTRANAVVNSYANWGVFKPGTTTYPDFAAPVISNIAVGELRATRADVTWNTSKKTTGEVFYRPSGEGTWLRSDSVTGFNTVHLVNLRGLTPNKTYQYYVVYASELDQIAVSAVKTFTTPVGAAEPVAPKKPDFAVTDITLLKRESSEDDVLAFVKVKNFGAPSPTGELHMVLVNETNGTMEEQKISGPFAGSNFNGSFTVTLDNARNMKDSYRVTANIDTTEAFDEENEKNNTLTKTLYPNRPGESNPSEPKPDLTITKIIRQPDSNYIQQEFYADVFIKNIGGAEANLAGSHVSLAFGTNLATLKNCGVNCSGVNNTYYGYYDLGEQLAFLDVNEEKPFKFSTTKFNGALKPVRAGAHYLYAQVDVNSKIAEAQEDNNTFTGSFDVVNKISPFEKEKTVTPSAAARIEEINTKAKLLQGDDLESILTELKQLRDKVKEQEAEIKYLNKLTAGLQEITEAMKERINNFITYGVDENTKKLGAGERAVVMSSYKNAFDKLPDSEAEFSDAIKIASGHWPTERSETAEAQAKIDFKKVYRRAANMDNANDSAAIMVMAYGLRQRAVNRNLASERKGIKIFTNVYGHAPKTTEEWNKMQAITYSGAKR